VFFAKKAAITITQREGQLLKCFQDFIESGKYPIGKKANKGQGARSFRHPSDFDDTWALLQKLDDAVLAVRESPMDKVNVVNLGRTNQDDRGTV
jgi:hypothetical protein